MWSILAAMIQTAHDKDPSVFHFKDFVTYEDHLNPTPEEMKAYRQAVSSLSVAAGLCGATLRVVNTFLVAICGTHMHTSMNAFLGIFPMFVLAYPALADHYILAGLVQRRQTHSVSNI